MTAEIHVPLFEDATVIELEEHDEHGVELEVVIVPADFVCVCEDCDVGERVVVFDYVG